MMRKVDFDPLLQEVEQLNWQEEAGEIREMQRTTEENNFFVAFVGCYSAGKSCLINNLLGRELLPHGTTETTTILTYIRYAEETCAYIGLFLKDPANFDNVVEGLRKIPEVVECHYTTGGFDMFIKIYAFNNHHLMSIIHDKLQPLGLSRSETVISFNAAIDRQLPIVDLPTDEDDDEEE